MGQVIDEIGQQVVEEGTEKVGEVISCRPDFKGGGEVIDKSGKKSVDKGTLQ